MLNGYNLQWGTNFYGLTCQESLSETFGMIMKVCESTWITSRTHSLYYRVHCWSPPLELSCHGWREEEKKTSREAWSSWSWHSSSSPEWKLPPCPMTGSPSPSVFLREVLQPKISSVICFPSQKKKSDVGHLAPWETTNANWILKIIFNLACIKVYLKKSSGKSFVMWGISLEREKATLDASFV